MGRSIIAVYSATGNSLAAARRIGGGDIHLIEEFLEGRAALPDDTEKLGIIFPVYCFGLPYPVQRFISDILGKRDSSSLLYIYGIATYSKFPAAALADLETELGATGLALSYGASVKMPAAYLPLRKKAVGEIETLATLNKVEKKLGRITDDIAKERIEIPRRGIMRRFLRTLSREATKPRKSSLSVLESCNGCGICTHICPMDNIRMDDGRAVIGDECISCFACYHRCPENAIAYPGAEGQYKGLIEDTKELFRR